MLKGSGIHDLAQFYQVLDAQYANPVDANKYYATIGDLAARWYFASPGIMTPGPNGEFALNVRLLRQFNPKTSDQHTTDRHLPESQIQVEVFNSDWSPVCILGSANVTNGGAPFFHTAVSVIQSGGRRGGQGTVSISAPAWDKIVEGGGAYWVVQYLSYSTNASPFYFWSSPATIKKNVSTTSFQSDPSSNDLDLAYDIIPPGSGWPANNGTVTIPSFTVSLYAVPTGSLDERGPRTIVCFSPIPGPT